MKVILSQKEVSKLILNHLVDNKLTKAKEVDIHYIIDSGRVGNELTVIVEEK